MLDAEFISALTDSSAMQLVFQSRIDRTFLLQPYSEMFQFVIDYFQKYGASPTRDFLNKEFAYVIGTNPLPDQVEVVKYYIDELKNREKFNRSQALAKKIFDAASQADTPDKKRKCVEAVEKAVADLHFRFVTDLSAATMVDITVNAERRYTEYEQRRDSVATGLGIPMPWEPLQNEFLGWQPGDFCSILGMSGLGKTMSLMICGAYAHSKGANVLVFSHEMTIRQLSWRFDALVSKLEPKLIRKGQLTHDEEVRYKMYLKVLSEQRAAGNIAPFIINQGSPSDGGKALNAVIKAVHPDLVIVDGAYLFAESYSWDKVSELTKMLKHSAMQNNVPILCSNQWSSNKLSQSKSAFSASFINDSSIVIRVYQDPDRAVLPFMNWMVTKGRDASEKNISWVSNWDFEEMNFNYRPDLKVNELLFSHED